MARAAPIPRSDTPAPALAPALALVMATLAAGDLLFLVRALSPGWALACGGALVAGLALFARGGLSAISARQAFACLALAAVALALGGEGRWFAATPDWLVRDAVLHDLARGDWPVVYATADGLEFLRAPVGMYLVPALVGNATGERGGQVTLLVQNALLLAGALALFAQAAAAGRRGWIMVAVLLVFSGWDVVGQALTPPAADAFPMHIERWAIRLEYSSTVTGLFWAPNHELPAMVFAGAWLAWRRGAAPAAAPCAVAALSLLWTPLAVVGMAPFVLLLLVETAIRREMAAGPWLGAALVGLGLAPTALYLRLQGAEVLHGWNTDWPPFWRFYPLLIAFEVLPLAWLALGPTVERRPSLRARLRPELWAAVALLVLLPFYRLGVSNDLMMRAAAPALALLAAGAALRLSALFDRGDRVSLAMGVGVLVLGAVTPAIELRRALTAPVRPLRGVSLSQAWAESTFAIHDDDGRRLPMSTYATRVEALRPWRALFRQADGAPVIPAPTTAPPP